MGLNFDMVGKKTDPVPFTYDEDRVILYALGIGAGVKELDFVYEKNLRVFPTFAVLPFMPSLLSSFVPMVKLNLLAVLHGEQKIVLHKPIPTSGTIHTTTRWDSVYDKGDKGTIINISFETRDENGDLLFENKAVVVDRSAGNFGGDRGLHHSNKDPGWQSHPGKCRGRSGLEGLWIELLRAVTATKGGASIEP